MSLRASQDLDLWMAELEDIWWLGLSRNIVHHAGPAQVMIRARTV